MKTLIFWMILCSPAVWSESLWLSDDLTPADGQFVLAPVKLFTSINPEFPLGGNDGPLWQGKGLNTSLSGGAAASWNGFTFELRPEIDFSQNLSYPMLNGPGDYGVGLDRVQSYGNGVITHIDAGQSEVRWQWNWFRASFGTKALVYGADQRTHILMSDNAGGYPHLDLGTAVPVSTPWGSFEGRLLWGALSDSTLYDRLSWGGVSDWRLFHGLTVGYSPPFWPEFTVGGARIFYSPWATITPFKVFESLVDSFWKVDRGPFAGGPGKEDDIDQLAAMYFDYSVSDFRIYGELARNDHASDLRDFLVQPDHTFGYVMGFWKEFDLGSGRSWDIRYEQADLGLNFGTNVRVTGSWYRRLPGDPGYTLGGQLLGAAIGPGSNGNFAELGYKWAENRVFFSWERIANDVDYWIKVIQPPDSGTGDITFISTLGYQSTWQSLTWMVAVGYVKELDRYWIGGNDRTTGQLTGSVTWQP